MAQPATRRRGFLRVLPLAYLLVLFCGMVAAVFAYWICGSTTSRTPNEVRHEESIEQKYVGKIVIPTDREGTCQLLALDNCTGQLQDQGYGPWEYTNYDDRKADPDRRRLIEIGKAFHRRNSTCPYDDTSKSSVRGFWWMTSNSDRIWPRNDALLRGLARFLYKPKFELKTNTIISVSRRARCELGSALDLSLLCHQFRMRLSPQLFGDLERLDLSLVPPGDLVAGLMQLAMMATAEGNGELIADLETKGARLGEAEVMRVARLPAADQTGLRGDKPKVRLVAQPLWLGDRKHALVDAATGRGRFRA